MSMVEYREEKLDMDLEELGLLNQIGREFSSTLDLGSIISRVMGRVKEVLCCEASSVILYDEVKDSLVFYAASGAGAHEITGLAIPHGKGIAGWVYQEGKPLIVDDAVTDKRFYSGIDRITGVKTRSLICVPIRKDSHMLGVLEGINRQRGPFDQKDLAMLIAISQLAAISIENSKIHGNLERSNSELRVLNREMEEFVHFVSHDLQTPLASIEGYANLIRIEMGDLLRKNAALLEYLQRIEKNCRNTLQFVRRLLEYGRLKYSKIRIDEFNPLSVLHDVLVLIGEEVEARNTKILFPKRMPSIRYDRHLFHHILLNLLQNCLKHAHDTPAGLVIEVGMEEDEYIYRFYVRDNGPGLSRDEQRKIFNIYERREGSSLSNGYGIGLAFVKKAVQLLEGSVWVQSRKGEGTTFYFSVRR
jgi:signal transduction histidine kinase